MKKVLALLLAIMMMMLALTACGGNAEPSAAPTAAPATANPSAAPSASSAPEEELSYPIVTDGSVTLSWFMPVMSAIPATKYDDLSQNYSFSQITKNTGINIKFQNPSIMNAAEQFNLMVTSGEYTDLATSDYVGGGDKAIEDEVFLRLNELMDKFAPDYMALLNADPTNLRDATTDTGNRWRFCQITEGLQLQFSGLMIRQDWLDELGIKELPQTYDELHEVLVQFRDNKTEGPFLLNPLGITTYNTFNGAFGVASYDRNFYYIQKDKKAIFTVATDGYKEYLKLARQWYQEKLINQDFFSYTQTGLDPDFNLLSKDKIGLIEGQQLGSYYADAGMAPKGAYFEPLWSPVKNKGDKNTIGLNSSIVSAFGTAIFTTTKYPEEATRFLNYFYTDQGYIDANFGTEGETFNYVDGKPVLTDMIAKPEAMSVWDAYCTYLISIGSMRYNWHRTDTDETVANRAKTDERWANNGTFPDNMPINLTFTAEEGAERASILNDLKTYIDSMTVGFIVGNNDIDKEWDTFVSTLKQTGSDRLTEINQASLDRYYSR
jgi:putative aldouronate transport system substrate-binding protein